MRLERMALSNIGPFSSDVSIDFSDIEGRLIAVTGGNGQGKSTLLEMFPGALFRETPNRGSLANLATSRSSYVEVEVVNGARYRIRQTVDALSGKGESLVLDAEGQSVLPSSSVKAFDSWAHQHLVSPEVLYASIFAPQGNGGFLDLKPSDKKAVLLRILGIEHLEKLAQSARDKARAEKTKLEVLVARMGDVGEVSVNEAACGLGTAQADKELAQKALAEAEAAYKAAEAEVQALRSQIEREDAVARAEQLAADAKAAEVSAAGERAKAAGERLEGLKARFADLEKRIKANKDLQAKSGEISAAVARDTAIAEELSKLESERATVRVELEKARAEVALHTSKRDSAIAQQRQAKARKEAAEKRLAAKTEIEAAIKALPEVQAKLDAEADMVAKAEAKLEELRGQRVAGAEDRIVGLRAGLVRIADGVDDPKWEAAETINNDSAAVAFAKGLPVQVHEAERSLSVARQRLQERRGLLADTERVASRVREVELGEAELESSQLAIVEATEAMEREDIAIWEASALVDQSAEQLSTVEGKVLALVEEKASLAANVAMAPHLAVVETKIAERSAQIKATAADIARAESEAKTAADEANTGRKVWIDANDAAAKRRQAVVELRATLSQLSPKTDGVESAKSALRDAEKSVVVAEGALQRAKEAEEKLQGLKEDRSRVEADLADWERLAQDLGRDGLQALEIDAAGPELTELINDLLHTCVGPRWTVSVETTRLSADGKRQIEGCEVNILDSECGVDPSKYRPSGGQHVLVGEAISLALSMLACRRAGVQGPTLVRDETGAALDPVNARAYVAMLRRASEIVGASHVLFVSHNPDVQEMADARIVVADGKVQVAA